ncbi:membrane-associated phosphatidylinositol transfer protein 1-like isoform X2 [Acanthaster planci]|uniref:Membrane-associated phosphatidylinositol transfer protein 1-like isoform X2 n=1 Tax=Acanthaster planci TaxID=133434 RepID=A0A8B7ZFX1_ACAPL|nr:membrane-associated phosphatidylinositol transfer protein 1-like isoform X2 [Acanthaster planci]
MLIKEYRIPLPLSVEEYRIAQLYMIQKKSRQESSGAGSGVEILINQPYEDGPGGRGQYTHKVYHIGSHLPGWFRAILPKTALRVEEESWNAYPYTKTRYTCPFVEKFSVEVETKYFPDAGHQENVFNLPTAECKSRLVEFIDMVKDPISSSDYKKDEDPKIYVSKKTGRGPLTNDWITLDNDGKLVPIGGCTDIMCAYKLCKVEFRYWGMQNRIEKFIHDVALNRTMLHAHRQAWCWQDEWVGLTIEDIRQLEREAAKELMEKMAEAHLDETGQDLAHNDFTNEKNNELQKLEFQDTPSPDRSPATTQAGNRLRDAQMDSVCSDFMTDDVPISLEDTEIAVGSMNLGTRRLSKRLSTERRGSSNKSDMLAQWRMNSIQQDSDSSEDEFFDAQAEVDEEPQGLSQWSSLEALNHAVLAEGDSIPAPPLSAPATGAPVCDISVLILVLHGGNILDGMQESGAKTSDVNTFKIAFDAVVRAHFPIALGRTTIRLVPCPSTCCEAMALMTSLSPYGNDISTENKVPSSNSEFIPLGALPILATSSPDYPDLVLATISNMNKVYSDFIHSEDGHGFDGQVCVVADCMGAVLGYDALCCSVSHCSSTSSPANLSDTLSSPPSSSNDTAHDKPSPHRCASTSRCMERLTLEGLADPASKRLSLSSSDLQAMQDEAVAVRSRSETSPTPSQSERMRHFSSPVFFNKEIPLSNDPPSTAGAMAGIDWRRTSSCSQASSMFLDYMTQVPSSRLEFEVQQFFMFGSPLGIVLAHRRLLLESKAVTPPRPACRQIFNLFHRTDPSAARIEPLLNHKFSLLPPCAVARYQKYPLGDGHSINLVDCIAHHTILFLEGQSGCASANFTPSHRRLPSSASTCSEVAEEDTSGMSPALTNVVQSISGRWWGAKRLDYALYCPEALQAFPTGALPHLFHASYWESTDVVAFILRQIFQNDCVSVHTGDGTSTTAFIPSNPREKWQRKRTSVKMKQNVNPNHRVQDTICLEGATQTLTGRFMYSSLDMVTLTGEKVDIHIVTQPPSGEWVHFATEITNSHGRLSYTIPTTRSLSQGIYPVKMVVRGDHTSAEGYLAIVPPKCECVVFSIDGSFTASVSIMGRDPKVRAGAVDVVRHWQDLNYLIIYITARPSMQKQKVVAWLAQHNFPHGMVYFIDGLSTDPLRQKANYLKSITEQHKMVIHAAYGSSKDIWVYSTIGLRPSQIYIVGKVSKKYQTHAQRFLKRHSLGDIADKDAMILSGGYAAHLDTLARQSRPAVGNSRLILRKGCFSLPGQSHQRSAKQAAARTVSYGGSVVRSQAGSTGSFRSSSTSSVSVKGTGSFNPGGSFKMPKSQPTVKFEI